MEPGLYEGDFVFVRKNRSYEVGDVVAYLNPDLGHFVLHRIIQIDGGSFILKGDNNDWVDSYQPYDNEIIGEFWFHIPKLGRLIAFIKNPVVLSLLLGSFLFLLLLGMMYGKEDPLSAESTIKFRNTHNLQTVFTAAIVVFLISIFLFVIAFTKPSQIEIFQEYMVLQDGEFSYSGSAPEGIYDQPSLSTGQPIFPPVTCEVDINFDYQVNGEKLSDVEGTYNLAIRIFNNRSGLSRSQILVPATPFNGNVINIANSVDFCEIANTIIEIEEKTGASSSSYSLDILPFIEIAGKTNEIAFETTFQPELSFDYDHLQFAMNPSMDLASVLAPTGSLIVEEKVFTANQISFFTLQIPVLTLRYISSILMGISIAVLIWGFLRVNQIQKENPILAQQMIQGVEIFDVSGTPGPYQGNTLTISDFSELAKLASIHRKIILRAESINSRIYYFEYDGSRYQFVEEEIVDRAR